MTQCEGFWKWTTAACWTAILAGWLTCNTGCAEQTALKQISQTISAATVTLAEKVPIESGELTADGEIVDPTYDIRGEWTTGIHATVSLRGVKAGGSLAGRGKGEPQYTRPELATVLYDIVKDKSTADKLADAVIDRLAQRAEEAKPKPPTQPAAQPCVLPLSLVAQLAAVAPARVSFSESPVKVSMVPDPIDAMQLIVEFNLTPQLVGVPMSKCSVTATAEESGPVRWPDSES